MYVDVCVMECEYGYHQAEETLKQLGDAPDVTIEALEVREKKGKKENQIFLCVIIGTGGVLNSQKSALW